MERLQVLCKGSRRRMRINPPAMERIYEEEFEQELLQAFNEALEQGQDAAVIYTLLIQHLDWDCMCDDPPLLNALLQRMHPDAIVEPERRMTVLHQLLSTTYPPPLVAPDDPGTLTMQSLLARGATPDLQDAQGSTALHLLIVCTVKEKFWPDLEPEAAFQGVNLDDMYRDDERTDYLEGLGTVLLRAGWSLDLPNARGRTARQLLRVGQQHARAKRAKAEHVAAGRSGFAAYFGSADIQQQILRQVARAKRLERVLQDLENVQP